MALYIVSAVTIPFSFATGDLANTIPLLFELSPPIIDEIFLMSSGYPFSNKSIAVQDKKALLTSICIIILSIISLLTLIIAEK